ncbi:hypothetical protein MNBD_GAMMA22-2014 [hydrothermal vent metagenome]|uniref:Uncharacterized protein n=1 Tax=hydrothermal vent metagenome TaxID=652676 RepID=A0A3B1B5N9_9ZZZZ
MTPRVTISLENNLEQIPQAKLKTERYYFVELKGWYFHCRDGNRGPFQSKQQAKQELVEHIEQQKSLY